MRLNLNYTMFSLALVFTSFVTTLSGMNNLQINFFFYPWGPTQGKLRVHYPSPMDYYTSLYFRISSNHYIFFSNFLLLDDQNRLTVCLIKFQMESVPIHCYQ